MLDLFGALGRGFNAGRASNTELDARTIATEAMLVAGSMDIYTNDRLTVEEI